MMKRSVLGFSVVLVLGVFGVACGSFDGEAADVETPLPDDGPIEGKPIDVRDGAGFFVRPSDTPIVNDDGIGSRTNPFKSLTKAIAVASAAKKNVFVCLGDVKEEIVLADGVSMIGGLDCTRPEWSPTVALTRILAPKSPAMRASRITTSTRIEGFEIVAPNALQPSESSVGLFVENAPLLTVVRSKIVAGNGARGADGVEPPAVVVGGAPNGVAGLPAKDLCAAIFVSCDSILPSLANPGDATCNGVADANLRGGYGGPPGVFESFYSVEIGNAWRPRGNSPAYEAGPGETRVTKPGSLGRDGAPATAAFTKQGYSPGIGVAGTNGTNGTGGGGGKGVRPGKPDRDDYRGFRGWGGPSGGAGGCGGVAGTPGAGGGASIAVYAVASPFAFVEVELVSGNGGDGGRGTFGASPTRGGSAGPTPIPGTEGVAGGNGGRAGTSGSGGGGSSIAIAFTEGEPSREKVKITVGKPGNGVQLLTKQDPVAGSLVIAESPNGLAQELGSF